MNLRKIIVGYSGSERSRDAVRFGAILAREANAELIIANAYGAARSHRAGGEERMLIRSGSLDRLREADGLLPYASRARFEAVESRSVVHALRDLAAREAADLIVLGATSRGAVELRTRGSIPERLLHEAPCAVAVAPRGYSYERQPGVHVIGVAVDGSPEAQRAVDAAASIALATHAAMKLIGVVEPVPPPAVGANAVYVPETRSYRDALLRELEQTAERLPHELRPEIVLVGGEAAAELTARAEPLSLLVMGSHCYGAVRRALLGSVSAQLLRAAPCPVLVVPRGAERELLEASA